MRQIFLKFVHEVVFRVKIRLLPRPDHQLVHHERTKPNGVTVIVSKNLQSRIAKVQRPSDRLMSLNIDADDRRLVILSAYTAQPGCDKEDTENFWQGLS